MVFGLVSERARRRTLLGRAAPPSALREPRTYRCRGGGPRREPRREGGERECGQGHAQGFVGSSTSGASSYAARPKSACQESGILGFCSTEGNSPDSLTQDSQSCKLYIISNEHEHCLRGSKLFHRTDFCCNRLRIGTTVNDCLFRPRSTWGGTRRAVGPCAHE